MNITILRSTVCQPQRCGHAPCHAISHAASFIAPPRRVAQASHKTRNFAVTKAIEDGTGPEQVLDVEIIELFTYFQQLN